MLQVGSLHGSFMHVRMRSQLHTPLNKPQALNPQSPEPYAPNSKKRKS